VGTSSEDTLMRSSRRRSRWQWNPSGRAKGVGREAHFSMYNAGEPIIEPEQQESTALLGCDRMG
jgi:hypothetical protein